MYRPHPSSSSCRAPLFDRVIPALAWVLAALVLLLGLASGSAWAQQAGPIDFLFSSSGAPRASDTVRSAQRVWKIGEFTAVALRFARTIVRPVQQLTAGADALKSGRFEQAYVEAKGRDELGQLARTFNVMVDVLRMPANSFGTVPTPAIIAPIEFSMRLSDYQALGGHMAHVRSLQEVLTQGAWHNDGAPTALTWQAQPQSNPWPLGQAPMLG